MNWISWRPNWHSWWDGLAKRNLAISTNILCEFVWQALESESKWWHESPLFEAPWAKWSMERERLKFCPIQWAQNRVNFVQPTSAEWFAFEQQSAQHICYLSSCFSNTEEWTFHRKIQPNWARRNLPQKCHVFVGQNWLCLLLWDRHFLDQSLHHFDFCRVVHLLPNQRFYWSRVNTFEAKANQSIKNENEPWICWHHLWIF